MFCDYMYWRFAYYFLNCIDKNYKSDKKTSSQETNGEKASKVQVKQLHDQPECNAG